MSGRVLVTGGAKRLGRAIVLDLAGRGMDVCIHYNRSRTEAEDVAEQVMELGRCAYLVQGDLSKEGGPERVVEDAAAKVGGLDALVNSASVFPSDKLMEFTFEELAFNMRVNTYAPLVLCRAFAKQCDRGAVVNMLDSRILSYDKIHVSYHLSKRALDAVTRMLASELAPSIRVNAVAPGLVLPPVNAPKNYVVEGVKHLPLQKQGTAQDVADAVAFLLNSGFITGQTVYVDGGRHLNGTFYG